MDWPYHFSKLGPEQVLQRRHLLDRYANMAQLSILLPLFLIRLTNISYRLLRYLAVYGKVESGEEEHGNTSGRRSRNVAASILKVWRKLAWWMDGEVWVGWGTRKEAIAAAVWFVWLGWCVVRETGDDYLHLTKRFGIVAASQLPIHYLLSAKTPYDPIQLITSLSHEELNPYHRLLGRILIAFFSMHAVLYLNFYVQASLLSKRIRDTDVQLGLAAIICFLVIGTSTLSAIRTYSYHLFYIIHITLSPAVLVILYFHVSPIRIHILETAAIFVVLSLQRYYLNQRLVHATLALLPNTSLVAISIKPPKSVSQYTHFPGQHIYLSSPQLRKYFPRSTSMNPYSIANVPSQDTKAIQLVVRELNGTTKSLGRLARESPKSPRPFIMERPYGAAKNFPDLLSYDTILLVAGGVGATFTLPIYLDLVNRISNLVPSSIRHRDQSDDEDLNKNSQSQEYAENVELLDLAGTNSYSNCKTQPFLRIHFAWSVRNLRDAQWGLDALNLTSQNRPVPGLTDFKLYITGSAYSASTNTSPTPSFAAIDYHRPDLHTLVDGVFGLNEPKRSRGRVAVLAIGTALLPGSTTYCGTCTWNYVSSLLPNMERFILFLALTSVFLLSIKASPTHGKGSAKSLSLTVQTLNGPITGHQAPNRSNVIEYLGIPYAKPPLGSLRFAPPERYNTTEPLIASEFVSRASPKSGTAIASNAFKFYSQNRSDCPQTPSRPVAYPEATAQELRIVAIFANQYNKTQSEDCLYLNVWGKATPRFNKPVLVFFHGGRYSIGATNSPFYNGQYFADAQDVIVVSFNFRINIFGYPGAPGESQNLGLQDQRLAVEWVRDNVAAFGGDPCKITIFGQSSGSSAVDYWSYAYPNDPIVSGLISQSGNVFSFPINSPELAAKNWYNASALLGCGSSGDVMPCMRSKNFTDIKAAAAKVLPPPASSQARSQPAFQPTDDNITIFADYYKRSSSGAFAKIPYLAGNTDNEAGYYKITAFAQKIVLPQSDWDAFNLETFTCPHALEATNRANAGVPTWRYRYFGDWDNLRLYPTSGAYHGSDLEMIFGASEDVSGLPESKAEVQMKEVMQRAWAAFADDPERGLERGLGWPEYGTSNGTVVVLGYNNNPKPLFIAPSTFDKQCSAYLPTYMEMSTPEQAPAYSEPDYAKSDRKKTDYPWYLSNIDKHLLPERDQAWAIRSYPCTGLGVWLVPFISRSSAYPTILKRLRAGDVLMDVGCFLGGDMRRLVFDGAPSTNLYGVDIVSHWDVGYALFNDKDRFAARFIEADILSSDHPALLALRGRVDIISVSAVMHQWAWRGQVEAAKKLVALSKPGSLVVGYQIGNLEGKRVVNRFSQVPQWRHDPASFEMMWNQVGAETGSTWETKACLRSWEDMGWDPEDQAWMEPGDRVIDFVVSRII
ncbi:MAG: hypothetical protein Q9187_001970 [Circinaria calcarea]